MMQRKALVVLILLALAVRNVGVAARTGPRTQGTTRAAASEDYVQKVLSKFFSHKELGEHLMDFTKRCGAIANYTSIGTSVRKQKLWVLEISNKPGVREPEPYFKYIANMHGDETSGRQLLLALAEWLCANYQTNAVAARVVNNMHLFLMPTMNPDGYAAGNRENARGVDLNRNFPDAVKNPSMKLTGNEQPETLAVINWTGATRFTASANMHEGAVVANYPWDQTSHPYYDYYNATSDDSTFRYLATTYARNNPTMLASKEFPGGITNGAAWYSVSGGMQDWNYVKHSVFEITLELNDYKSPPASRLPALWEQNRESMLQYALTASLGGVRGQVQRWNKKRTVLKPLEAEITVLGSSTVTKSLPYFGEFFRPLAPGTYTLQVSPKGYPAKTVPVIVPNTGEGVVVNVQFP